MTILRGRDWPAGERMKADQLAVSRQSAWGGHRQIRVVRSDGREGGHFEGALDGRKPGAGR